MSLVNKWTATANMLKRGPNVVRNEVSKTLSNIKSFGRNYSNYNPSKQSWANYIKGKKQNVINRGRWGMAKIFPSRRKNRSSRKSRKTRKSRK